MKRTVLSILILSFICFVLGNSKYGVSAESIHFDRIELLQEGFTGVSQNRNPPYSLISNQNEDDAEINILNGLRDLSERINLSDFHLSSSDLKRAFQKVINSSPDLFYVSSNYSYSYNEYVTALIPQYKYTKDEIIQKETEYNGFIKSVSEMVNEEWNEYEKALFLHDYIVSHFEYDTSLNNYDVYSFFCSGKGVCQAYTLTYIALLNSVGIQADAVTSENMNHTWNKVLIDDNW